MPLDLRRMITSLPSADCMIHFRAPSVQSARLFLAAVATPPWMKFARSGPITINNLVYTAARGILTLVHHCEQHGVVSVVPDSGKVAEQDRRDPRQLVSHIQSSEISCRYVESVDASVQWARQRKPRGVLPWPYSATVGLGGIHQKLPYKLGKGRRAPTPVHYNTIATVQSKLRCDDRSRPSNQRCLL